ncbi:hypothetical protein G5I_11641 [Acromyrmex echinatior]|uniref:Uncharacterized protein n=1 Tax=Acromyrmex echinatior TaxID=103372 RepID=F4X054_ACREC|nr:hypothetical protein G5I_11641 [Acromyrmex echinatior]
MSVGEDGAARTSVRRGITRRSWWGGRGCSDTYSEYVRPCLPEPLRAVGINLMDNINSQHNVEGERSLQSVEADARSTMSDSSRKQQQQGRGARRGGRLRGSAVEGRFYVAAVATRELATIAKSVERSKNIRGDIVRDMWTAYTKLSAALTSVFTRAGDSSLAANVDQREESSRPAWAKERRRLNEELVPPLQGVSKQLNPLAAVADRTAPVGKIPPSKNKRRENADRVDDEEGRIERLIVRLLPRLLREMGVAPMTAPATKPRSELVCLRSRVAVLEHDRGRSTSRRTSGRDRVHSGDGMAIMEWSGPDSLAGDRSPIRTRGRTAPAEGERPRVTVTEEDLRSPYFRPPLQGPLSNDLPIALKIVNLAIVIYLMIQLLDSAFVIDNDFVPDSSKKKITSST